MTKRFPLFIGILTCVFYILESNVFAFSFNGVPYAVGSQPEAVAVSDLNQDGKLDLAVANSGANNVSILLGNGDGTFNASVNYGAGNSPSSVVVGDCR